MIKQAQMRPHRLHRRWNMSTAEEIKAREDARTLRALERLDKAGSLSKQLLAVGITMLSFACLFLCLYVLFTPAPR
jgi:hypothetical protein